MGIHQHEDSDEPVRNPQEDHYTGCLLVAEEDEGEGQFGQCFHSFVFCLKAVAQYRRHPPPVSGSFTRSLNPLHHNRRDASCKLFNPRSRRRESALFVAGGKCAD